MQLQGGCVDLVLQEVCLLLVKKPAGRIWFGHIVSSMEQLTVMI